jgi:kinesin family protein 22
MQGTEQDPGLIPRVAERLLRLVAEEECKVNSSSSSSSLSYSISVSYLEIYNEKVFDLLRPGSSDLPIREDASRQIVIPNLSKQRITNFAEFQTAFELGCKNRRKGATKLNPSSSRSHAILLLSIQKKLTQHKNPNLTTTQTSKLHLIDLAGSEDNRKTENKGVRLAESSSINTSLFALAKVVNALNEGSSRIPYRDSKLTRLLSDSLGGSSFGVMIANVSPAQSHYPYTYHTLNFASKSRLVVNNPIAASPVLLDPYSFAYPPAENYSSSGVTLQQAPLPHSGSEKENSRRYANSTTSSSSMQRSNLSRTFSSSSSSSSSFSSSSSLASVTELIDQKVEAAVREKLRRMISPALRNNLQAQALLSNNNNPTDSQSLQDRLEKLEQHLL